MARLFSLSAVLGEVFGQLYYFCEVSFIRNFLERDSRRGAGSTVSKICLVPNSFCLLMTDQTADLLPSKYVQFHIHSFKICCMVIKCQVLGWLLDDRDEQTPKS